MKLFTFIVALIIIVYYIQGRNNTKKDVNIYQIDEFNMIIYKKYIAYNQPIIILNKLTEFPSFEVLYLDVLKDMDIELYCKNKKNIIKKKKNIVKISDIINNSELVVFNNREYFNYFTYENIETDFKDLTQKNNIKYSLNILPTIFNSPIIKAVERTFILIYDGEIVVNLINPYNKNNKLKNVVKLDDLYIYDNKSKHLTIEPIQIICRTGKILVVPTNWWFYIETIIPSLLVMLH